MTNSYIGAEEALLDRWVESKLGAYTAFNTISPGLTSRIYNRVAPVKIPFPYIVYQTQSPPTVVRGVGPAEVMVDTMYIVKGVAQGPNYEELADVASGIRTAMVYPNGELTPGGAIFTSRYEMQFSMTEVEGTQQWRHLGGQFRIQAQAS
jgi:hypothetical protein